MANVITTAKCIKCGATYSETTYGLKIEDPLGIPLIKCNNCGNVMRDKRHKEWIQMNLFQKLFAISPWSLIWAFFVGMLPHSLIVSVVSNKMYEGSAIPIYLGLPMFVVIYSITLYVFFSIRVNTQTFYYRFLSSIKRTKNQTYREMLSSMGKIYDESVPKFLFMLPSVKAEIEYRIEHETPDELFIPTMQHGLTNMH